MAGKKTTERRERLPEEIYIDEALASGRAKRGRIGLKCLGAPGTVFQARAVENMLDLDHAMRFTEDLVKNGPDYDLFPIVVFRKPGTAVYLTADGIHRTKAYTEAGRLDIPAYIIDRDESDALFYCTMCNQLAVKSRKYEDKAKAVSMLLADSTWWNRSSTWIANHVACSPGTVNRIRRIISAETGKLIPARLVAANGKKYGHGEVALNDQGININKYNDDCYKQGYCYKAFLRIDGVKKSFSGKSIEIVRDKLIKARNCNEIIKENRRVSLSSDSIGAMLRRYGFKSVITNQGVSRKYPGVSGWHRPGIPGVVVVPCDFGNSLSLLRAIGRIGWISKDVEVAYGQVVATQIIVRDPSARKIILCYKEDGPFWLIDLYRQAGFEFMTPEEMIAMLESESQSGGQSP